MRRTTLYLRSLRHYGRTNLAVTLGVMIGTAALTGALVVGDSVRGSLRDAAIGRLGRVDFAMRSTRFFREALADEMAGDKRETDFRAMRRTANPIAQAVPAIILRGGVTHAGSQALANGVNVLGIDERFWALRGKNDSTYTETRGPTGSPSGREVILNEPLARELSVAVGDDVLVRIGKPSAVSTETLLGRRDDTTTTLRLRVSAVIPAEDIGAFSLNPRQTTPRNAYIPLPTLQRALDRRDRVNTVLFALKNEREVTAVADAHALWTLLMRHRRLIDLGLTLREDDRHGYVALESDSMLLPSAVEWAVDPNAWRIHTTVSPILTYLANRIRKEGGAVGASGIPYSVAAAVGGNSALMQSLPVLEAAPKSDGDAILEPGEILLNEWAAEDLSANVGDGITLDYYVTGPFGRLETRSHTFRLAGIVALRGRAADPGLTPTYKGVTDTQNLSDWDPPFPMDLGLIRDKDEKYWDAHHATPKAFITLTDGQRLWAEGHERFGRLTAIQVEPTDGATLAEVRARFERGLLRTLDPTLMGFSVDAVRTRMMRAGEGTTDFGMLFVSFSFFLIASAAMLVALLFRLGAEGRAREVGLLLATGFMPRTVTRMLISEGTILAVVGSAVGTAAALSYAWLMLTGLRTWWSAAANAPFLRLYAAPITLIIGFACGVLVALLSIAWSLRGLSRRSPRSLLAGAVAAGGPARAMGGTGKRQLARAGAPSFSPEKRGGRTPGAVAKLGEDERGHARLAPDPSRVPGTSRGVVMTALAFAVALFLVLLPLLTDALPETGAFFGSGSALLIGSLLLYSLYLGREQTVVVRHGGWTGWIRLGARHARRRPGRSVLTTAMIASATFLVSSLEAFHLDVGTDPGDRHSGTGGFCLYAESSVPLPFDLNTPEGRESLNIRAEARALLSDVNVLPYRLRPGDESSCLNLYRPTRPRILGAPEAAIARGGFTFSTTLAETDTEKENPWLLLSGDLGDNVIPVIGDEAAVKWQLHLGLGKELTVTAESGAKRRLRFVALLKGSVLQDELIIAESHFVQLFPSITGHAFFLIDTPPATADNVEPALERELAPFGFDIRSTTRRLADYLAVQNTYLSTFQTLGGFGLILGTVGLAAVLLRNVLERRGELALMRALGFSRAALGWIVFSENASLLLMGLATGVASAALAVAPHVIARPAALPWTSLGFTLGLVSLTGLVAVGAATALSLRGPLLPALRSE